MHGRLTQVDPGTDERLAWLVLLPLVAALAFGFGTAPRTDLLGHWLAGWGGSLGACWLVARASGARPWAIFAGTALSIGLGWILESTMFALGGFDPLDFGSQTLGALLAGASIVQSRAGDAIADPSDDARPLLRSALGQLIFLLSCAGLCVGAVFAFA